MKKNINTVTYKFSISQKIYLPFKRLISFFGSILGIVFCLVLLWWWVFPINVIVTKGHPVFVQERLGKNKKVFGLFKFRSMKLDANPNLAPSEMSEAEQEHMKTKFGEFLRKTSIDETLQLLNIFVGQMAFVGPRPGAAHNEEELVQFREKYQPSAFLVKPGLSGYAQVKMKRDHNPEEKAKWDSYYIGHMSFWMDVKVFFTTVFGIFKSEKGK